MKHKIVNYLAFGSILLAGCGAHEKSDVCFAAHLAEVDIETPDYNISNIAIVQFDIEKMNIKEFYNIAQGFCKTPSVTNDNTWLSPDSVVFVDQYFSSALSVYLPIDMCTKADQSISKFKAAMKASKVHDLKTFSATAAVDYWVQGELFTSDCFKKR